MSRVVISMLVIMLCQWLLYIIYMRPLYRNVVLFSVLNSVNILKTVALETLSISIYYENQPVLRKCRTILSRFEMS